ncbi:MAG: arsenate reductase ArsC [Bacteroidota bacterium]
MNNLLVLCTGNSCRSQMMEGWIRYFGGTTLAVKSAGVETHGVNSTAIRVMNEAGVDISHHTSNHVDEYAGEEFDVVLTVCDNAKERCPVFPSRAKQWHHNFTDPAKATGTPEEILDVFRRVRDEIRDYAKELVEKLNAT